MKTYSIEFIDGVVREVKGYGSLIHDGILDIQVTDHILDIQGFEHFVLVNIRSWKAER